MFCSSSRFFEQKIRENKGPTKEELEARVKREAALRKEEREEAKKKKAQEESKARFAERQRVFQQYEQSSKK
jgi:hypothetical protein